MKIAAICGDHPRNLYLAKSLNEKFGLQGLIIEKRDDFLPKKFHFNTLDDENNYHKHFTNRSNFEKKYFGEISPSLTSNVFFTSKSNLSSLVTIDYLKNAKANIIFVFGVGIIKDPLLSYLPKFTFNLHSGLTPRYKGTACNFWPFYFLEPNWAGMTFHQLTNQVDMGNIFHQVRPKLSYGDTIHEVACKSVILACKDVEKIIFRIKNKPEIEGIKPKSTGRLFKKNDFRPEHLRLIYNQYDDNIVDYYLDGVISPRDPELINIEDL